MTRTADHEQMAQLMTRTIAFIQILYGGRIKHITGSKLLLDCVKKAMTTLTPRELTVIAMYYGLNGFTSCHSLQTIGTQFGISRSSIHQTLRRGMYKLSHASRMKFFEPYVKFNQEAR